MLLAASPIEPLAAEVVRHRAVAVLRDQALSTGLALHGFVILPHRWHVLVTPHAPEQLKRFMQICARQISSAAAANGFGASPIWEGRFRSGLVAPGRALEVLWALDALLGEDSWERCAPPPPWGSAAHCDGRQELAWLKPLEVAWSLGNTPFARQSTYARLRAEFVAAGRRDAVIKAAEHGWAWGEGDWLACVEKLANRPLKLKSPGRRAFKSVPN
jgi:putative transposase